jgi:hypothetical protein
VKINVDAMLNAELKSGGWGAVYRDASADVCFAAAGPLSSIADALHAETAAMMKAVKLADHLGVGRVIFETDCLVLEQTLGSTTYDHASVGILFSELKFRMCTHFIEDHIIHVLRDCNKPAHLLAALCTSVNHGGHSMWTSNYPDDVTRAVTGD